MEAEMLAAGWTVWGILGVVGGWLVKSSLGSLAKAGEAYAARKGENLATKEDFNQLLEQLRRNTEATEQIRTEIAHEDWTVREWKAARARKLEELIAAVNECHDWLQATRLEIRRGEDPNLWRNHPALRARALQAIYFPDLQERVEVFIKKCEIALNELLAIKKRQFQLMRDGESLENCLRQMEGKYADQANKMDGVHSEIYELVNAVPSVLVKIYGEGSVQPLISPKPGIKGPGPTP